MKTQLTFRAGDQLLIGAAAKQAWADQSARCNCGCGGVSSETISGTCSGLSAEWMSCPNCSGQAVGRPLVYRTVSQISAAKR